MKQPPDDHDPMAKLLDVALPKILNESVLGVLAAEHDLQLEAPARRLRFVGVALLIVAIGCMLAVGFLHETGVNQPIVPLVLGATALLLLLSGAWAVDKAGNDELRRYYSDRVDLEQGLAGATGLPSHLKARRRLHFGRSLIVLAGFCVSVAAVPLPSKETADAVLWAAISVLLLLVGWWQIEKAIQEERDARRTSELKKRELGLHIQRIK